MLVSHRRARVMIDCGDDWLHALGSVHPTAIVLTHAHPDHVGGLRRGAPCPVYAPSTVWHALARWRIDQRHVCPVRSAVDIDGIAFTAFRVDHSVVAPAVGYLITAGRSTIFYAPDVLRIPRAAQVLSGITIYVGDAAAIARPIIRIERRTGAAVGHASIAMQLDWCADAGVRRAIFTHCGRGVVAGGPAASARVQQLGRAAGVEARVAEDGLRVKVRAKLVPGFEN